MDLIVYTRGFFILLMSAAFLEGLKVEVKKHKDVSVMTGEKVHLQCPLTPSSEVLQIMWQRILPEEVVTVATCLSSRHRLNPEFSRIGSRGKGIQNCSLVVYNVTRQDEGCYLCLFITPSDMAHAGKVCLQIHELQGVEEKQVNTSVPGERILSDDQQETDFENIQRIVSRTDVVGLDIISAVMCFVAVLCACVGAAVWLKKRQKSSVQRDIKNVEKGEVLKTPQKIDVKEQNGTVRKRTPESNEAAHSQPLLSARKLNFE